MSPIELDVLLFEVGGRRFGIPVTYVKELVRVVTTVPLPGAPEAVEGVMNLRGCLVPVLDPRSRLGLKPKPVETTDLLIITWSTIGLAALRVDHALGLMTAGGAAGAASAVSGLPGMVSHPEGLAPVLRPDDLLTGPQWDALRAVLEGPGSAAGPEVRP